MTELRRDTAAIHGASARSPWHIAGEYVSMTLGYAMLALLCLGWLPCALLLQRVLPERRGEVIARRVHSAGFRFYLGFLSCCGFRFDLAQIDRLRDAPPSIIVANHPSLLDALLLISRLPNAVCIMKAKLCANPLFGTAARLAGYIRNDDPIDIALATRRALNGGAHLVLFAEGTRTVRFPIDPFFMSTGMLAKLAAAPVQSVLIEFSSPYLGKAWPWWRPPLLPLTFRARIGQRFTAPQDVKAFTTQLEQYFREQLEPH